MASQHIGLNYRLYNIGTKDWVSFNQPLLVDNVGFITEITGIDSPEVREVSEDMVQNDGGIHGTFLHGCRTISINGVIAAPTSVLDRQTKANLLSKITNLLRFSGELVWTDVDGTAKYVSVRLQGPVKLSGGWNKTFHFTLVANDPNIYSFTPLVTNIPYVNETNRLLDPSGEVTPATTHFSQGYTSGSPTLTRVADPRPGGWGLYSTDLTVTSLPAAGYLMVTTEAVTVSPSSRLWCQAWGKAVTSLTNLQLLVEFFTSGGAYISGTVVSTVASPGNTWRNLEGAVTTPATAGKARICVYANNPLTGTHGVRMDDAMLVQSATYSGPHFNGHEPGTRWSGAVANSTTVMHGVGYITNAGSSSTLPIINLSGPLTNPRMVNMETGGQLWLNGYSLITGESATFNHRTHQVTSSNGTSLYRYLLPTAKQWFPLVLGSNQLRFVSDGTPALSPAMEVRHNNAWI